MWFFWFMAGLGVGWVLLKRPQFVENGISWIGRKIGLLPVAPNE